MREANTQFGQYRRGVTLRWMVLMGVVMYHWLFAMLPGWTALHEGAKIPITWVSSEAMNVTAEDILDNDYYVLRLTSPAHNWVAGRAFFLPTGRDITLGLSLDEQDTRGNVASVTKWAGLRMLRSYADPSRYSSYETFTKDKEGQWHSTDIFRQGARGDAGTGRVPVQSAVPENVADECLSPDDHSWSAFHEVASCEAVTALNIFRVKTRVEYPSMSIVMRVPYLASYLQQFIDKLQIANFSGITVDSIGRSAAGRPLWAIRLDDPQPTEKPEAHRTVVVIAREHASEHASSWVAHGALVSLLRDTPEARQLRKGTTWIFIPLLDPDGGADSTFDHLTDRFCKPEDPTLPPEVMAYTRYLTDYVAQGRSLDVVVSLHNVEANECPHLFCPQIHARQREETLRVNRDVFHCTKAAGYLTGDPEKPWDVGMMTTRLSGWCSLHFGSLGLNYEVNDRYPTRRLMLGELQGLGIPLVSGIGSWLRSDAGTAWHAARVQQVQAHIQARTAYWQRVGYGPEKRTPADLLNLAY